MKAQREVMLKIMEIKKEPFSEMRTHKIDVLTRHLDIEKIWELENIDDDEKQELEDLYDWLMDS